MERIVNGLANFSFKQNNIDELLVAHSVTKCSSIMAVRDCSENQTQLQINAMMTEPINTFMLELVNIEHSTNNSSPISEDWNNGQTVHHEQPTNIRKLPMRSTKLESMLKLKSRTIAKPVKRSLPQKKENSALNVNSIKKLYTSQTLVKFRPTNLETIYEGHETTNTEESSTTIMQHIIGNKKLRRSLSCTNGLNANKGVTKKRRAKIKKLMGKLPLTKKISMDQFYKRLQNAAGDSHSDNDA